MPSGLSSLEKQTNLGRVLWQRFRAQGVFYFASIRVHSRLLSLRLDRLPPARPRLAIAAAENVDRTAGLLSRRD
jgi:hypothetical protein